MSDEKFIENEVYDAERVERELDRENEIYQEGLEAMRSEVESQETGENDDYDLMMDLQRMGN